MWCGVLCRGVVWVWCGVVWCGVVWCGVVWCGVVYGMVSCGCGVCCGVWVWCMAWCEVKWCGVPKAPLPEGNGRDVYPQVQVNGRAVCVARAPCVSVWLSAERGGAGETWMPPSSRQLSSQKFPLHSLSLRLIVQA